MFTVLHKTLDGPEISSVWFKEEKIQPTFQFKNGSNDKAGFLIFYQTIWKSHLVSIQMLYVQLKANQRLHQRDGDVGV